jgi:hypothetical protein
MQSFRTEKLRITGLLAASAVGWKLPPAIFIKGNHAVPIVAAGGVRRIYGEKAWINQDAFIKWIDFEFPFAQRDTLLLVFDSARPHISWKVKDHLHARGILFAVISGGLTSLLQPCDVSWFKTMKSILKDSIDTWKANPYHTLTRGGIPRPPTLDDMSAWLTDAW